MAKDETSAQEIGARFGAQVMGGDLVEAPPQDSRLARLLDAESRYQAGELTEGEWDGIAAALMAEAVSEAKEING